MFKKVLQNNILELVKHYIISHKRGFSTLIKHDGFEHAGYLSFLLMLSIFPFVVFMVAVVGFIGQESLAAVFLDIILESELAIFIDSLKPRIVEITSSPPDGLLTFVLLSAVWTSSSMFEAIRTTLNKAYGISSPPAYILRRLISLLEFIVLFTILICVLAFFLFAPSIWLFMTSILEYSAGDNQHFTLLSPAFKTFRHYFFIVLGFVIISTMYYSMPNRRKKRYFFTLPGTLTVMILGGLATKFFKFYILYFAQLNLIYGGIAGVIITLIYFYICSLIFIYGAEINHNLEKLRNEKLAE